MRCSSLTGSISVLVACGIITWSAVVASDEIEAVLKEIGSRCTKTHDYDSANPGEVGEYSLGEGEKAWRECVYDGIRNDLVPISKLPEQYERIIAQDAEFTRAIEAGEMTRFDRWQKNRMAKQIALANEELGESREVARQRQILDNVVQKQLEMMLRIRPPPPPAFR